MALRYIRGRFRPRPAKVSQNVLGVVEDFDQLLAIISNPNMSVSQRVTAAGMIRASIDECSLSSIQEVWYSVAQLIDLSNQTELRRSGWKLALSCIAHDEINAGSYNTYFHAVIDYSNVEDFDLVLQALNALTQGGRRLSNAPTAAYRLPTVLLSWIQLLAVRTQELESNPQARDIAEQWGASTPANFAALLAYTANVLKFNMTSFDERDINSILLCVATIMRTTTSTDIIELCCSIIDTIMAFGIIPLMVLNPVLQVLSGISLINPQLKQISANTILNLVKSHLGDSTVQRLCRIVDSQNKEVTLGMRIAAASFLATIIKERALNDEEILLVEILGAYSAALDHYLPPLHAQISKSLVDILEDPAIKSYINYDVWESSSFSPLNIICKLGEAAITPAPSSRGRQGFAAQNSSTKQSEVENNNAYEEQVKANIRTALDIVIDLLQEKDSVLPMEDTLVVASQLSTYLSPSSSLKVVGTFASLHLCSPYIEGWRPNLELLLDQFYRSPECTDTVRSKIIELCEPVLMLPGDDTDSHGIAKKLFEEMWSCDLGSLNVLMGLLKDLAVLNSFTLFEQTTAIIMRNIPDQSTERVSDEQTSVKLEKIAATFVDIFISLLQQCARKATLMYTSLIQLAKSSVFDERPFVTAFALLCRLRVDEEFNISITEPPLETDYGAALYNQQVQLAIKKQLLDKPSLILKSRNSGDAYASAPKQALDTTLLLNLVTNVLQNGAPETVYLQVLINVAAQLANVQLFTGCDGELVSLRNFLYHQVGTQNIPKITNEVCGATKPQIIGVYIHILTIILGYSQIFTKQDYDKLMQTLVMVFNNWEKITSGWALHSLVICCYECPQSLQRVLPQILAKLQTRITNRDSSTHILEFLLTLSEVESLTSSFNIQEFKRAFGICFTYIQHATDTLNKSKTESDINASILSQYLLRLACVIISSLFLSIEMSSRKEMITYLIRNFVLTSKVKGQMDPINLCTYDLLCRYTYSNQPLSLTSKATELSRYAKEGDNTTMWMIGSSIVEIITNKLSGKSFVVVRRPTCTIVTAMKPIDGSVIATSDSNSDTFDPLSSFSDHNAKFMAQFWLLMMRGLDADGQNPIVIPNTPSNLRSISSIDRAPVVDFHKVGIIYIGPGQNQEQEILANTSGSRSYRNFLGGLGQYVKLKGNRAIYAGGLDTENDIDGKFTLAWVGKVSQITYHVITLMPNPEHDPSLSSKKRHIGNNYVNIYFDESGKKFDFDVVKSQFNFINIVISPTYAPGKFRVRAYRKEGLANVLAAFEGKVVDEEHLALFVRHLSVKASIYAKVYNQHGEYTDQWLYRLELIDKLRERVIAERAEGRERESSEAPEESQEPEYMRDALAKLDFTR